MVATLLLTALVASISPGQPPSVPAQGSARFPQGTLRMSERGHIAVATNLRVAPLDADPVVSARKFLAAYGSPLGVSSDDTLILAHGIPAGEAGTVVFRRMVLGVQVLDAHLAVAIAANGQIHTVTSSGALPGIDSEFKLDERVATAKALARMEGEILSVQRAYARTGARGQEKLHPYFLVGVVAQRPYRSHRFAVDAVTGEIGASFSQLLYAPTGKVYRISPSKPYATKSPAEACEIETVMSGQQMVKKHKTCALPEEVELKGLKGDGTLTGDPAPHAGRTSIYNCNGKDTYDTTACTQTMKADAAGNFTPPNMTDFTTNKSDLMSELMAYYQVDRHSRFMDSLDSTFVGLPLIPGFTNAYGPSPLGTGSGPFDNAFFDPQKSIMVFGQGSTVDFAYDGEVIYHEMTHAACGAIGKATGRDDALFPTAGTRGLWMDPLSLNEGNADAFALMEPGVDDPLLGEFDARGDMQIFGGLLSIPIGPNGYIRNMGAGSFHTCQGNGTAENAGRDGEAHDDGEIWDQYVYELHEGLKAMPNGVPNGATWRSPLAPAMFKALQTLIAMPTEQQTFGGFANAVESQVRAMYGEKAGDFAKCVAQRRDMAGCDGASVTVYSNEGPFNDQYVKGGWKGFYFSKAEVYQQNVPAGFEGVPGSHQWKLTVPNDATSLELNVCDISPGLLGPGGTGRLLIQKGKPVQLEVTGSGMTADWKLPFTASWTVSYADCGGGLGGATKTTKATLTATGCTGCMARTTDTHENLSGGDWYFLVTNTGGAASFANFKAILSGPTIPQRPATTPATCTPPWGPVVTPDAGTTVPDAGTTVEPDGGSTTEPDGGSTAEPDAGTSTELPCTGPQCANYVTPKGCGCGAAGMEGAALVALSLLALRFRARRRSTR